MLLHSQYWVLFTNYYAVGIEFYHLLSSLLYNEPQNYFDYKKAQDKNLAEFSYETLVFQFYIGTPFWLHYTKIEV